MVGDDSELTRKYIERFTDLKRSTGMNFKKYMDSQVYSVSTCDFDLAHRTQDLRTSYTAAFGDTRPTLRRPTNPSTPD